MDLSEVIFTKYFYSKKMYIPEKASKSTFHAISESQILQAE
jgi:hypothetical protein